MWFSKPYPNDPKTLTKALEWDNLVKIKSIETSVRGLADQEHVNFARMSRDTGLKMGSSRRKIFIPFEISGITMSITLNVCFFNGTASQIFVLAMKGLGWELDWGTRRYKGDREQMECDLSTLILTLV
jgi:hypothetical protein